MKKIGYKIREARQVDRVPYMLIIGAKEVENEYRFRPRPRYRSDRDHAA